MTRSKTSFMAILIICIGVMGLASSDIAFAAGNPFDENAKIKVKGQKKGGQSKAEKFAYSGTADADGRQATLEFTITGTSVTGKMNAEGVNKPNIRLPQTKISFTGTLSGTWEGNGKIAGNWTGGDYSSDGKLMSGYPTSGNITISMKNGKVSLQRTKKGYGYTFNPSGKVYKP